ncbi:replicative DNA helicase [Singulisphaera rosea]
MTLPSGQPGATRIRDEDLSFRLPPHSLETEKATLGSILFVNEVLHEIVPILSPEDFYRDTHQKIYATILDLYRLGKPIDGITLSDELIRRGEYEAIGGADAISDLFSSTPSSANAKYYAGIVRQKSIGRQLAHAARTISAEVHSDQYTAEELLDRAERAVFNIAESQSSESTIPASAAVSQAMARLCRRNRGPSGVSTGLSQLDALTDGFQPEQLVILAARPSMGKTQIALNFVEYTALARREEVLFISLEMGAIDIGERLAVSRSGVPNTLLKSPDDISPHEWDRLVIADEELSKAPILIDESPALTTLQILALARRAKSRGDLKLLVVDYLQLITPGDGDRRHEQVAYISRDLKRIARELKIPVVCLSQLNRASEGREDKRPRMADLRESGAIEQDADLVMLLHRPEYYDPMQLPGFAELIVAKNRNGATGTVPLRFIKEIGRFEDWVGPSPDQFPAPGPEF